MIKSPIVKSKIHLQTNVKNVPQITFWNQSKLNVSKKYLIVLFIMCLEIKTKLHVWFVMKHITF